MPPRTPKINSIVDPDAPSPRAGIRFAERLLIGGGWSPNDSSWLAPLLLRTLPSCGSEEGFLSDTTEVHIDLLSATWKMAEGNRDAALLLLSAAMTGCVHIPPIVVPVAGETSRAENWAIPEDLQPQFLREVLEHGADFESVVRNGWPKHLDAEWTRDAASFASERTRSFFGLLLRAKAVQLSRVVDLDSMRNHGRSGNWYPTGFSSTNGHTEWSDGVSWRDLRSLRVWIWHTGLDALQSILPAFKDEPVETVPDLAVSVAQAAATWVGRPAAHGHYEDFANAGAEFQTAIRPYFERLDALVQERATDSDGRLRQMWMLFFRMTWDGDPAGCPDELRHRLMAAATEDLSRMRKIFSAAKPEDDSAAALEFRRLLPHFQQCCAVLAHHGEMWRYMKPLLLALRSLGTPAVARDLRYWNEFIEDPLPQPWSAIPMSLMGLLHAYAGREQQKDAQLQELRTQLASYCLERLTDRWGKKEREAADKEGRIRTDADMVEASPSWRYGMIRAIMDLRVNPEGRGHRALFWSSKHDPDPEVMEIALQAYEQVRHQRALPSDVSPRRAVMSALWWLRRAHLLGLGLQPDSDGAQRTRRKEQTRTKERERDDNSANDPQQ